MNETTQDTPAPVPPVLAEVQAGGGITISQAGKLFPSHRGGKMGLNPATIWRWILEGANKPNDGGVVMLEAVRLGHRWLTSNAAVARFMMALTEASSPKFLGRTNKPKKRSKSAEKLEAAGC